MNHRYGEYSRSEGRDRERHRDEEDSHPYGQREPYNTARSRWGEPDPQYGPPSGSRYSESQYGQRRAPRDPWGRDLGSGGLRARGNDDWARSSDDSWRRSGADRGRGTGSLDDDYREGQYGSGDFGFERGRRGEPSFGESPGERYESSQRYFGSGTYGEGGARHTGGWEPRREERPGLLRRLFKQGPKGYQRSDERLREDISERLMQSYDIDSSEVTVTVVSGKVTLDGTVPDRYMKHYIEDVVDACPGVQDIDNRIRVDASSGRWPEDSARSTASPSLSAASTTAPPKSSKNN